MFGLIVIVVVILCLFAMSETSAESFLDARKSEQISSFLKIPSLIMKNRSVSSPKLVETGASSLRTANSQDAF